MHQGKRNAPRILLHFRTVRLWKTFVLNILLLHNSIWPKEWTTIFKYHIGLICRSDLWKTFGVALASQKVYRFRWCRRYLKINSRKRPEGTFEEILGRHVWGEQKTAETYFSIHNSRTTSSCPSGKGMRTVAWAIHFDKRGLADLRRHEGPLANRYLHFWDNITEAETRYRRVGRCGMA